MVLPFTLSLLTALFISDAKADSVADDHLIVPGERVGFITRQTTEAELKEKFPESQIKRVWLDSGESEYTCHTEIFTGSDKALTITWAKSAVGNEEECMALPDLGKAISVSPATDYWKTKEGIGMGSTLTQLEKANGAPITFMACECCGDGGVMTLNKGKLSGYRYKDLGYTKLEDGMIYDRSTILGLSLQYLFTPSGAPIENLEAYKKTGEIVSSNLPQPIKDKITIGSVTVYLEKNALQP